MARREGQRLVCERCGAELVYTKACPCPAEMAHAEICCGQQMKTVADAAAPPEAPKG